MGTLHITELPPLPKREPESHKGTYGRILLVAGSPAMPGAAVLAARAALRSGAGLVTVAFAGSLTATFTAAVPEAIQLALPEPGAPEHDAEIDQLIGGDIREKFDAIGIGPGLGTSTASRKVLARLLEVYDGPQVLDADALNLVAEGLPTSPSDKRIWTPHPGEFQRLTGTTPSGDAERLEETRRFAGERGGTVLLKGNRTVVHDGDRFYVNLTGNPGMATAGSGDVLTGAITSLLGQGVDGFDASQLGAYLHGYAGDIAAESLGQPSLTAGDLIDYLPEAFRRTLEAE